MQMESHLTIKNCSFFRDRQIIVHAIYRDDPFEKCFMVEDSLSGEKFKVRINHLHYLNGVQTEAAAFNVLKKNGLTWIPKTFWEEYGDSTILVYEYFPGLSLDKIPNSFSKKEAIGIVEQLAFQLSQIHKIHGTYFGELAGPKFESWGVFLWEKLTKHLANACQLDTITISERKEIESCFHYLAEYFDHVKPTFLHFDVKPANILYDSKTRQATLVDFELCRYGDTQMENSRLISYHLKKDNVYRDILLPLVEEIMQLSTRKFVATPHFKIYHVYNLLAYYTTSLITRNIKRDYLLAPLHRTISSLKSYSRKM